MYNTTMALKIKIPKHTEPEEMYYPDRLSYPVLVEYAKRFNSKAEVETELTRMLVVLQLTEKEKAKRKSKDPLDAYSLKLTRFTQLFKTLLAIKASWPHVKIPYYLAAEPGF
jgi:hypothetical protein